MLRHPPEQPRTSRGPIGRQRPAAREEQLFPTLDVAIFHHRELFEKVGERRIFFDGGQRSIQVGGVPFVLIVVIL